MRTVRLGEGVDSTGEFSAAALERTFAVCDQYAQIIEDAHVSSLRFVATSASRDVSNRAAFVDGVQARLGVRPDVITGTEEAELSFLGAVSGLPAVLIKAPALVVDIGGGSTEFVLGSTAPTHSVSVNVGCVRMTERHLFSDPPTADEIARVEADLDVALASAAQAVPVALARTFIGVAGSVTTIAAMALDLPFYDPVVLHGAVISRAQVEEVTERLLAMTRAERAALPFMHAGRVDVIGGGAMVLRAIMRTFGLPEVVTSETDILDGIAYRLQS
jgi:exopolyphosphatase/guanosine-5'-triphosphate,3'-diphosphate pyrophosphatase